MVKKRNLKDMSSYVKVKHKKQEKKFLYPEKKKYKFKSRRN